MKKVADCMAGRDNNFTLLRAVAATLVLYYHSFPLSIGAAEPIGGFLGYGLGAVAVTVFFAVSGFLVTKSYQERKSLMAFLEARFLRIFPALAVLAFFCVLVIGPLFTTLRPADFFVHPQTLKFLYTHLMVNGIEIELPGVFNTNIYPVAVNGSLWTLPYEISMYEYLALLGLTTVIRRRRVFNVLYFVWALICFFVPPMILVQNIHMRSLSFAFFSGAFLYINRDRIPLNGIIALGLCSITFLFSRTGFHDLVVRAALAYTALWFALVPSGFIRRYNAFGDYSYGLYIYAFPVQQSLAAFWTTIGPLPMFLISGVVTLLMASLSWHLLEKRALRLKGRFISRIGGAAGRLKSRAIAARAAS
jgi:peptidoglycan/LPS O-acetylase OafA/YrhL